MGLKLADLKNVLKLFFLAFSLILICACSSKPAPSPQQQLQSQWYAIAHRQDYSLSSVRIFAAQAQAQQNWQLVWKSQLLLCQTELSIVSKRLACDRAALAVNLLNDSDFLLFQTLLTRYLHLGDTQALNKAKTLATTDKHRAQVLLTQNQIPDKEMLISIERNSAEYAQYLYLQGKNDNRLELLELSVESFKALNQMHKVAEVLFVMAKIQLQMGAVENARKSGSESLLILDNLKNQEAYRVVKEWYDDRLPTR